MKIGNKYGLLDVRELMPHPTTISCNLTNLEAIEREKQLKDIFRNKKEELINSFNPEWKDLYPKVLEW